MVGYTSVTGVFSLLLAKFILLLFVGVFQSEGSSPTCEIGDLRYTAIDLNLTLSWNASDVDLLANETILYTVLRSVRKGREHYQITVPHCTNISSTTCYLAPMFPTGDEFRWREYFLVKCTSSLRPTFLGKSRKETFASWDVEVSAPVIYNISVTSSNITVWVHGPKTPYIKNNKTRMMGDPHLAKQLSLDKIFYKLKLTNVADPDKVLFTDWTPSNSGKERFTFSNLFPYTSYLLQAQCKLGTGGSNGANITDMELRTKQRAPEFGQRITNHTVIKRSCGYRNVLIQWEENPHQRPNVEIISYTLTWKDIDSQETHNLTVPVNNRSAVATNMIRFHDYHVTVSSRNSAGSKEGETHIIEKEIINEESYQPTDVTIEQISRKQWNLTWNPPTEHQGCIIGYQVVTYIDGAIEEEIVVEGYDVKSTLLHFRRVGNFIIELNSITNISRQYHNMQRTRSKVQAEYNVEGWKFRQWSILCSIMLLLLCTVIAVIIMSKKVCCDLSRLPDISKSRSMRLASANEPFITSLKTPPEPEVFHSTKSKVISITTSTRICTDTDDVFESKAASTETLLGSTHDSSSDRLQSGAALISTEETGSSDSKGVDDSDRSAQVGNGLVGEVRSEYQRPKSGYVPSTLKTKPSLTVYIPRHISTMKTDANPHSSSADSGICSSPYLGASSDYIQASANSDSNGWCGYDFQSESPYVATSEVEKAYRSESTSSEVDLESVGYRKVGPESVEGYLPMSPFSKNNPETVWPTMDPYSKACRKLEQKIE